MVLNKAAESAEMGHERRRFPRVTVELKGRLFVPDEECEVPCTIMDMSPGGAQVACEKSLALQATVILYIEGFGRFEGAVARLVTGEGAEGKFGVRFNCSLLKQERVAERLNTYLKGGTVDTTVLRRHDRRPTRGLARFTRASGDVVQCEVLDLSLGGVSLATDVRPQIGEIVLIGQMAGRVARIHENGIAIEFVTPPPEKASGEVPAIKLSALR